MIETVLAENGSRVLRRRGRLLASRFDPKAEASAWLEKRLAFIDKIHGIFVLGLGSGYHVQALLEKTAARLLVIENSSEIIEAVSGIQKFDPKRVQIESVAKARDLRSNAAVKAMIKKSFVVLTHPASYGQEPEFFKECAAQLNGREWGALTWQWKLKGLPSLDSAPRVDAGGASADKLTIYDLEQTELVQNSEERERLLIKALRELVK